MYKESTDFEDDREIKDTRELFKAVHINDLNDEKNVLVQEILNEDYFSEVLEQDEEFTVSEMKSQYTAVKRAAGDYKTIFPISAVIEGDNTFVGLYRIIDGTLIGGGNYRDFFSARAFVAISGKRQDLEYFDVLVGPYEESMKPRVDLSFKNSKGKKAIPISSEIVADIQKFDKNPRNPENQKVFVSATKSVVGK